MWQPPMNTRDKTPAKLAAKLALLRKVKQFSEKILLLSADILFKIFHWKN